MIDACKYFKTSRSDFRLKMLIMTDVQFRTGRADEVRICSAIKTEWKSLQINLHEHYKQILIFRVKIGLHKKLKPFLCWIAFLFLGEKPSMSILFVVSWIWWRHTSNQLLNTIHLPSSAFLMKQIQLSKIAILKNQNFILTVDMFENLGSENNHMRILLFFEST